MTMKFGRKHSPPSRNSYGLETVVPSGLKFETFKIRCSEVCCISHESFMLPKKLVVIQLLHSYSRLVLDMNTFVTHDLFGARLHVSAWFLADSSGFSTATPDITVLLVRNPLKILDVSLARSILKGLSIRTE
jgi:hypothetical protein